MDSKGNVLLVDDDPSILKSEGARLRRLGYDYRTASGVDEAWPQVADDTLDVVITDIHMPGTDGLSFVEELQSRRPGLPVIVITGEPAVDTAVRAVGLGVRAYLVKPFSLGDLAVELEAAVGLRHLQRALGGARRLLTDCQQKVEQAEALLAGKVPTASAQTAYLDVMLWQVVSATSELCRYVASTPGTSDSPAPDQAVSLGDLVGALHDTVDALERTKSLFKSKDLGELRRQIQGLLDRLGHRP